MVNKTNMRNLLAAVSIITLVVISIYVLWMTLFGSGPHYIFKRKAYNVLIETAINIRLDLSRNIFELSYVILGTVWALLVIKEGEAKLLLSERPEMIMGISAILLLYLSCVMHLFYISKVMQLIHDAGDFYSTNSNDKVLEIPDIYAAGVNYLYIAQMAFLFTGVLNAALTFFSAHRLR